MMWMQWCRAELITRGLMYKACLSKRGHASYSKIRLFNNRRSMTGSHLNEKEAGKEFESVARRKCCK